MINDIFLNIIIKKLVEFECLEKKTVYGDGKKWRR